MKRILLASCVFLFGGIAVPVMADSIKPGQRMIYDDRAPAEPSQLEKPIFKKRIVVPKQPREEPVEDNMEEEPAPDDDANLPDDDSDTSQDEASGNEDKPPPIYIAPQQGGSSSTEEQEELENGDVEGIDFDDLSPRKSRKLQKLADDFMKEMPHENVTQEQLVNMAPEDRERVHKEIKAYTDKYADQIKRELDE